MRVAGLDLALTATGVATDEGCFLVTAKKLDGAARLRHLRDGVVEVLVGGYTHFEQRTGVSPLPRVEHTAPNKPLPDVVAIEGYSYNARNGGERLGELGGVIRLRLFEQGVPFVEVSPASLKTFATGRGNAKKDEVFAAAIRRLGYAGSDNNEADAAWLREMALCAYGDPTIDLPANHLKAIDKVAWPALDGPLASISQHPAGGAW